MSQPDVPAITEDDIANYLASDPHFFERHAELLASVQLQSGFGGRAVSLQERQAEMLRDKIKGLEQRIMEMIRNGNDNVVISDRLHRWTRKLFLTREVRALPDAAMNGVRDEFLVPQAAIKVWGVAGLYADESFAQGVSEDAKTFAGSLVAPHCGVNSGFDVAQWLEDAPNCKSLAIIALRAGASPEAFGCLVLGSPDPQRFIAGMGTEFLVRIGETASAALSALRPSA